MVIKNIAKIITLGLMLSLVNPVQANWFTDSCSSLWSWVSTSFVADTISKHSGKLLAATAAFLGLGVYKTISGKNAEIKRINDENENARLNELVKSGEKHSELLTQKWQAEAELKSKHEKLFEEKKNTQMKDELSAIKNLKVVTNNKKINDLMQHNDNLQSQLDNEQDAKQRLQKQLEQTNKAYVHQWAAGLMKNIVNQENNKAYVHKEISGIMQRLQDKEIKSLETQFAKLIAEYRRSYSALENLVTKIKENNESIDKDKVTLSSKTKTDGITLPEFKQELVKYDEILDQRDGNSDAIALTKLIKMKIEKIVGEIEGINVQSEKYSKIRLDQEKHLENNVIGLGYTTSDADRFGELFKNSSSPKKSVSITEGEKNTITKAVYDVNNAQIKFYVLGEFYCESTYNMKNYASSGLISSQQDLQNVDKEIKELEETLNSPVYSVSTQMFNPSSPSKERIVLFSIHGTFSDSTSFGTDTSKITSKGIIDYAKALSGEYQKLVELVIFDWSGELNDDRRTEAAYVLANWFAHYKTNDICRIEAIAHSYGCDVLAKTAQNIKDTFSLEFDRAITLAGPDSPFLKNKREKKEPFAIKEIFQFWGRHDVTQGLGSMTAISLNPLVMSTERKWPNCVDKDHRVWNIRLTNEGNELDHINIKAFAMKNLPALLHEIKTHYRCYFDLDACVRGKLDSIQIEDPIVAIRNVDYDVVEKQDVVLNSKPVREDLKAHGMLYSNLMQGEFRKKYKNYDISNKPNGYLNSFYRKSFGLLSMFVGEYGYSANDTTL